MAKQLVTCRKCGKLFDYDRTDGVCPKCARFYSATRYNEEEALLQNILSPANEENCSYHGDHNVRAAVSGHSERQHAEDVRIAGYSNKTAKKKSNPLVIAMIVIVYVIIIILSAMAD